MSEWSTSCRSQVKNSHTAKAKPQIQVDVRMLIVVINVNVKWFLKQKQFVVCTTVYATLTFCGALKLYKFTFCVTLISMYVVIVRASLGKTESLTTRST